MSNRRDLEKRIPWADENCGTWLPDVGWDEILTKFFDRIDYIGAMDKIEVVQIKEKFGTLRLYVDVNSLDDRLYDIVQALVSIAERESEVTCERCGKYGKVRDGSWLLTLCNSCYEKAQKRKASM